MGRGSDAAVFQFGVFYKAELSWRAQEGGRPDEAGVLKRKIASLPVIWTRLSRRFARSHDARALYAVDAKGCDRSSAIILKMSANRPRGMATSASWKAT